MAIVRARMSLVACMLCAAVPPAFAQEGSLNVGEQSTSSSTTTTTSTRTTGSLVQDDAAGADQDGDPAFGNFGGMDRETSSTTRSHSESRSRSSDASVEVDLRDDDWRHDRHDGAATDQDMVGNWTLGQESGSTCTIQLKDNEWFGGYGAYVPAGCPDGFFSANRWVMSGRQLLITDTNNEVIGRFRPSGGGRWSGRRESDGARLFLNPSSR